MTQNTSILLEWSVRNIHYGIIMIMASPKPQININFIGKYIGELEYMHMLYENISPYTHGSE